MNHPELVHGLELLPCATRDGWIYIPHADGKWVTAAKLEPFSLAVIDCWKAEQRRTKADATTSAAGEVDEDAIEAAYQEATVRNLVKSRYDFAAGARWALAARPVAQADAGADTDDERCGPVSLESELRFRHENDIRNTPGYVGTLLWKRTEAALASSAKADASALSEDEIQWEISAASTNPAWLDVEYGKRIEALCRQRYRPTSLPSFEAEWEKKAAAGYKYGREALANVKFGYTIAADALAASAQADAGAPSHEEIAVDMLARWCVAIDRSGTGWDDWDEHYKDAAYRPGPLREKLDAAMAEIRKEYE